MMCFSGAQYGTANCAVFDEPNPGVKLFGIGNLIHVFVLLIWDNQKFLIIPKR